MVMRIVWSRESWDHYLYWQTRDAAILAKINTLIRESTRTPFTGLGQPEPLRGNMKGWWSRRITGEHRFIYRIVGKPPDQALEIATCRWHYE